MRERSRLKYGFTLIELLVVISIIALLMGVLLPALGRARNLAQRSVCMANVRRLALSVRIYADSYDGKLPPDRLRKAIGRILDAEVISGDELFSVEIEMACGCDLMSDVLAFVKSGALLLTGLTNPQVVRTADMTDLAAVCFVRGKRPDQETVRIAESKSIPLLMTPLPMFESCGRLCREGLSGCSEYEEQPQAKPGRVAPGGEAVDAA